MCAANFDTALQHNKLNSYNHDLGKYLKLPVLTAQCSHVWGKPQRCGTAIIMVISCGASTQNP